MKNRELAEKIYLGLNSNFDIRGNGYVNFIEKILNETEWTPTENLPPVDKSNQWNKEGKTSKDYLCYSNEWGLRFGRYYHNSNHWTIDGVHSSTGVKVEYYREINLPKK